MSLTVDLDEDVSEFLAYYAKARGVTLSDALNELVRRAETVPQPEIDWSKFKRTESGLLVVRATGNVITSEMVKEYSEDELIPDSMMVANAVPA